MSICQIQGDGLKKLEGFFVGWDETMILSCLQGCMGTAWADSDVSPKAAQLVIADFCFFAGEPSAELVKNCPPGRRSGFIIMIPQNGRWAGLIEDIYGENAVKVARYAIKKEKDIFDASALSRIVENVGAEYEIKLIDCGIYDMAVKNKWSEDLCSQFEGCEDYLARGLGVAALHKGELVSGASSYTVYRGGIEIEIDTREDYRRRGLALACGARLILACLEVGLYPSWDAQNKGSVALAQKLGYHFDKEYPAYEVTGFGEK